MGDFTSIETRRARRQRTCDDCGKAIMPGDTYVRAVGVWEGHFGVFCSHQDCHEAAVAVQPDAWADGMLPLRDWCDAVSHADARVDLADWPGVMARLFGETGAHD